TAAEIDDLAAALLPKVGEVSIVAEERHEIGAEVEASLNQVRIEIAPDQLPADERELDMLCGRLVEAADSWARGCIADRHAEVSELSPVALSRCLKAWDRAGNHALSCSRYLIR